MSGRFLDLRGTPCPVNFIRCKLTLEQMSSGDCLEVCLDLGEPEAMVLPGLSDAGHRVECIDQTPYAITIEVIRGGCHRPFGGISDGGGAPGQLPGG